MQPLSDGQVREALGEDTRILKYSELKNYGSMEELLPTLNSFFILLLEEEFNKGHWCAMMRLKEGHFYFNSYGIKYEKDVSVIPRCIRRILGEDKREFSRLLDGKPCDWNKVKLQGETSQTCGRWCVLAITMMCFLGYSPSEFIEFVQNTAKTLNKSFDEMVAQIVDL